MPTRCLVASLLYPIVTTVLFGAGLVAVLSIDALSSQAGFLIRNVAAGSLWLALPIAWLIARRMQARYWKRASLGPPRSPDRQG